MATVESKVRRRSEVAQELVGLESREGVGANGARGPVKEKLVHWSLSLRPQLPVLREEGSTMGEGQGEVVDEDEDCAIDRG